MNGFRRTLLAVPLLAAAALALEQAWRGTGGLLLVAAVAAAAFGLWLEAGALHTGNRAWSRPARRLQAAAAALLAAALGLLVAAFLRADVGYAYVWSHTAAGLPWYYRLAGTWAGGAGTTLLWAAFVGLALARLLPDLEADHPRLASATHLLVGGFVLALAAYLLADPPFAPTDPARLADPATADGSGLNELLVTPLMVVHPPIQFLAYALAAVPGGLALAGLASGDDAWLPPARTWGRWAWAAATAGLGLGALWAYYVLSFGGYWIWDPVETANLLPWLGLLAFLHAARDRDASGGLALATPLLAVLAWILTLFATVVVRSGLWVSVHAFTDPTDVFRPDAAARLLAILGAHPPTLHFAGLAGGLVFLAVALVLRRHGSALAPSGHRRRLVQATVALEAGLAGVALLAPREVASVLLEAGRLLAPGWPGAGSGLVSAVLAGGPLLAVYATRADDEPAGAWSTFRRLGALLLALALAVTFLLLVRSVNGFARDLYDARLPFVAFPILVAMTAMLAWHPLGRRRALGLAAAGAAASLLAAALVPGARVLAGAFPLVAAALAAGLARLRGEARPRAVAPRREAAAGLLLAAGLLGLLTWSNPPSWVPVPGGLVPVPAVLGALLWPASWLGLAGAVAAYRGGPRLLERAGAVGAAAAAGLGAGLVLGAAALALLVRGDEPRPAPPSRAELAAAARRFGIHLAHVGALVGVLGYAASTHGVAAADLAGVPGGDPVPFAGKVLDLGEARADSSPTADYVEALEVPVSVRDGGALRAEGVLRLYHRAPPVDHYDPHVDVQRGPVEDVVLHPRAMELDGDAWVEAHGETRRVHTANVTAVRFTAEVQPAMSLVWTGLSLVVGGTVALAAADRGLRRAGPGPREGL